MSDERVIRSIDGFPKSYSLVPEQESANAIVFVHGFAGSPTGTWCDFHGLSHEYRHEYPWLETGSLFFYSYDSLWTPILYNATKLRSFLETALQKAQPVGSQWKYKRLVLVGHSEGAVVIRRMILDRMGALAKQGSEEGLSGARLRRWIDMQSASDLVLNAGIRLFAPASAGTNFSGALGFGDRISSFFAALAASSVVRNELARGSPILTSLQSGTESVLAAHPKIKALQAKVLFGTRDHVVFTDKYSGDEIIEPWAEGHSHTSVCKPTYVYKRPLEFVKP